MICVHALEFQVGLRARFQVVRCDQLGMFLEETAVTLEARGEDPWTTRK